MSLHLSDLNHEIRGLEDSVRGHFRQEITRGQNRGEKTNLKQLLQLHANSSETLNGTII